MNELSLYELNNLVRHTLEQTMNREYWVRAEISELHVNRHCYAELVEKDSSGDGIVAKARAQAWANRWSLLKPMFESVTGQPLSAGMQILAKVEVTFHELYGFSLNITDIDPTFTLGDISRRRQEIIRQLAAEGIENMNKELSMPRLLQRIAVISSATAAGYGDFCNQLHSNKRRLAFHTELFQATMQGGNVESSIISALNQIAERIDEWDVVVIIRGGGATSDLSGFDTLALAENVAQFPLPIITGIGHERDDTVIDLISHTRVKTPTAAAEYIIHHQEEELNLLEELSTRIANNICIIMQNETARLKSIYGKLPLLYSALKAKEEASLDKMLDTAIHRATLLIERCRNDAKITYNRLALLAPLSLQRQHNRLDVLTSKLQAASPERILRLGFSITRVNGKAIKDSGEPQVGDEIETTLSSGTLKSNITWKGK